MGDSKEIWLIFLFFYFSMKISRKIWKFWTLPDFFPVESNCPIKTSKYHAISQPVSYFSVTRHQRYAHLLKFLSSRSTLKYWDDQSFLSKWQSIGHTSLYHSKSVCSEVSLHLLQVPLFLHLPCLPISLELVCKIFHSTHLLQLHLLAKKKKRTKSRVNTDSKE